MNKRLIKQDPAKEEKFTVKYICYVCENEITQRRVKIGQDKDRHEECSPGSAKWFKSKVKKTTEHFYKKKEE